MTPLAVLRAILKYRDGKTVEMLLFRHGRSDYRWSNWNRPSYLSREDAMRALRVAVETEPEYIGVDLTISPVDPPAAERAAQAIADKWLCPGAAYESRRDEIRSLIEAETNISAVNEAAQNLVAYCFKWRGLFAHAMLPANGGEQPRDLAMDGLLLAMIEALEKSCQQDFGNLKKVLKQPVSRIAAATMMPQKGQKPS